MKPSRSLLLGMLFCTALCWSAEQDWLPHAPLAHEPTADLPPTPPSIEVVPGAPGEWHCTFRLEPKGPVTSVALAGSFNGWSRTADMLRDPDQDGVWECATTLPNGRHCYKFVVDGDRWMPDPRNPQGESDGHEGRNSVLLLGRVARLDASDGRVGDGRIDTHALEHDPRSPTYFQVLGDNRFLLRYQTLSHDVERVFAISPTGATVEMHAVSAGPLFTLYETTIELQPVDVPSEPVAARQVHYSFVLQDAARRGTDPRGVLTSRFTPGGTFRTPDWARDAIWYQIMVDRFRNGDPSNDPPHTHPWTSDWFELKPYEQVDDQTFYKSAVFLRLYGGDLAGLEQQLDYLQALGVNALYLNPIFEAEGHHKYNATNFLHIDDEFGVKGDYAKVVEQEDLNDPATWQWTASDKLFLKFIEKAHARGFRVILDGVFNHVGTRHPAFRDVQAKGPDSPYADWFEIKSWEPFEYVGWAGHDSLPVFRKNATGLASENAKLHIFNVTRRWMDPDNDGDPRDGIDGWRLDVPNEVPEAFWVEWRQLVKSINPDAYITGEIWDRADLWLDGRHFDAVMNYQFAKAVIPWAMFDQMKLSASEMDRRLTELRLAYPQVATDVMQNLVDSHDTDRLASMARNPDRGYDHENRIQDNGPTYDNGKPTAEQYQRTRLVALVQMTYLGAPMIYYGDEVGMWGADDPTCRKPMLWRDLQPYAKPEENHVMRDHLRFYRDIIALRKSHAALRRGDFETLVADDDQDVWCFLRTAKQERLIVALTPARTAQTVRIPLSKTGAERWQVRYKSGAEARLKQTDDTLEITIPPIGGVVLLAD